MTTALALYSGGLDSILACRVVAEQNIRVKAIQFVTPFFGYALLAREKEYRREVRQKYGIDVCLRDVSAPYIELLRNPPHGYGKNFNPCVDCKILLMKEARAMMPEFGASFLISGEVIGQRPMSQRKDTLRIIERDSGCEDILLRPLCAKNLQPTRPEREGLVDRDKLFDFKGRSRTPQIELAERFGITDYPGPAGGCVLTDPILGRRIKAFYQAEDAIKAADIRLLLVGRHFRLPHGGWVTLGRNKLENDKIEALRQPGDKMLTAAKERPGPTAILRGAAPDDEGMAAALVVRYSKKYADDPGAVAVVVCSDEGDSELEVAPLDEKLVKAWAME